MPHTRTTAFEIKFSFAAIHNSGNWLYKLGLFFLFSSSFLPPARCCSLFASLSAVPLRRAARLDHPGFCHLNQVYSDPAIPSSIRFQLLIQTGFFVFFFIVVRLLSLWSGWLCFLFLFVVEFIVSCCYFVFFDFCFNLTCLGDCLCFAFWAWLRWLRKFGRKDVIN